MSHKLLPTPSLPCPATPSLPCPFPVPSPSLTRPYPVHTLSLPRPFPVPSPSLPRPYHDPSLSLLRPFPVHSLPRPLRVPSLSFPVPSMSLPRPFYVPSMSPLTVLSLSSPSFLAEMELMCSVPGPLSSSPPLYSLLICSDCEPASPCLMSTSLPAYDDNALK